MTTLTLRASSKKKLNLIEELAKELGIIVEKTEKSKVTKSHNGTTRKAILEAKKGKGEKMNIEEFRKLLYS